MGEGEGERRRIKKKKYERGRRRGRESKIKKIKNKKWERERERYFSLYPNSGQFLINSKHILQCLAFCCKTNPDLSLPTTFHSIDFIESDWYSCFIHLASKVTSKAFLRKPGYILSILLFSNNSHGIVFYVYHSVGYLCS
jgi:hypothetical protein